MEIGLHVFYSPGNLSRIKVACPKFNPGQIEVYRSQIRHLADGIISFIVWMRVCNQESAQPTAKSLPCDLVADTSFVFRPGWSSV